MGSTYFLSPQIPGVNDYLLSMIKDSLAYDIDGVHLDYIRYYGSSYDYSDAGRKPFIDSYGFDPANFLDHAEKIVEPKREPFPIRVLHAQRHLSQPWDATAIESLMDRAGVGFGFISESASNVDALRAPGALVISEVFDVSPELTEAIVSYVNRGGNVIWLDRPVVDKNLGLARLLGIKPQQAWMAKQWRKLEPVGDHPLAHMVPTASFSASAEYAGALDGGTVAARFDSGQSAVIVNEFGKGRTVLVCFNAASAQSGPSSQFVSGIVGWLRGDSGVTPGKDLMAAKRAQWLKWRANQVTDLVRRVHDAVKAKNPKLQVSVAGGFGGDEYYTCMRDGRRWMAENLIDFANPMDYSDTIEDLRYALEEHKLNVSAAKIAMIYPGLGLYTSRIVNGKKATVSQDPKVLRTSSKCFVERATVASRCSARRNSRRSRSQ